jgi:hypothetical protein
MDARRRHQIASQHIHIQWTPAAATIEERRFAAALLLDGTGLTITAEKDS